MRKKTFIQILIAIICIVINFSIYTRNKYDLKLIEFLKYSMPYSAEEKAYLRNKGMIKFGCDNNAPPLSHENEGDLTEGMLVDYMASISIESGIKIESETDSWNATVEKLKNRKVDMVDMFVTPTREKFFSFTQPIYSLNGAIVTISRRFNTIEDLNYKRIGVVKGDYAAERLQTISSNKTQLKLEIVEFDGMKEAITALRDGKVAAVAGDETVIVYLVNKTDNPSVFRIIEDNFYIKDVTIAVNKDDKILLNILNKTILKLKEKDVLTKAQEKWFGVSSPVIKQADKYDISFVISTAVIISVLAIILWNSSMRRIIKEKTNDLEDSKKNLRTIIDTLDTYLFVHNSSGFITECNNSLTNLVGKTRKSIIGSNVAENELLHTIYTLEPESVKSGIEYNGRYYDVTKKMMYIGNEETLIVFEDVTNEILYNRRLRQESKMEAVNHLSAGIAHEIRNPLGIIRNYLFILKERISEENSIHAIDVATESVNRINSLINNLLNFSKISSECKIMIDIEKMIKDIVLLEKKRLKESGIAVEIESNNDKKIYTSEETIKVIFLNLIDNAIDSFEGCNSNYKKLIRFSITSDIYNLIVNISDNGKGMTRDEIENIFNPFYTTKESGTGLGLYMVQSEIKKINGDIDVMSSESEGTTFRVRIPLGGKLI